MSLGIEGILSFYLEAVLKFLVGIRRRISSYTGDIQPGSLPPRPNFPNIMCVATPPGIRDGWRIDLWSRCAAPLTTLRATR